MDCSPFLKLISRLFARFINRTALFSLHLYNPTMFVCLCTEYLIAWLFYSAVSLVCVRGLFSYSPLRVWSPSYQVSLAVILRDSNLVVLRGGGKGEGEEGGCCIIQSRFLAVPWPFRIPFKLFNNEKLYFEIFWKPKRGI